MEVRVLSSAPDYKVKGQFGNFRVALFSCPPVVTASFPSDHQLQLRMTASDSQQARLHALHDRFRRLYGNGPVSVLRAPARINVLGEHVDYVSYLPTASLVFGSGEHEMFMLFRASEAGQVRGASMNDAFAPFAFTLNEGPDVNSAGRADRGWTDWLYQLAVPAPQWGNYVKGSVFFARFKYGGRIRRGFEFVIDSSIPPKAGASSSSALVVLAGAAIRQVNQVEYEAHTLARESSQAEWYVGTRGGAMDHTAICLSKAHHAVHLNYAEDTAKLVPLPGDGYRWVTFFSHEADKGKEVMLEYNERAAVARLLIPAVMADSAPPRSHIQTLPDELPASITLHEIERLYPQTFADCARAFPALVRERRERPLKLRERALHHIGEVQRVDAAAKLLRETSGEKINPAATETAMRQLGELINESHASLRDLYEVCTPQVNQLIEIIHADAEVYGARLMGGGFGGNVLALTTEENVSKLMERVQQEFYAPQNRDGRREGAVMISTPGEGLSKFDL